MMQSDLVKIILNLAYMPISHAKIFSFDKDFYRSTKGFRRNKNVETSDYWGASINKYWEDY
jgi:hypothetical protein